MKNTLLILFVAISTSLFAQHEKGNWFFGASSSNISFSSNTNSENKIDVTFTGFNDTLVNETDSLNLGFLFPYTYQLNQDKQSEFNINFRTGYFIADQFMFGLGFGYESETSLFKTNEDSKLANASLADSLMNVWFTNLPNVNENGNTYEYHYNQLYYLLAASANNDLTHSRSVLSISPFVRYNFKLRKGNSIFVDGSYHYAMGKEEMKDAISSVATKTDITSGRINLGVGYCAFLAGNFSLEPQFNYYLYNMTTKTVEDTPHPILSVTDMGEKTTEQIINGSGFNFSVGLSYYF
ncbi:MAG: hypothetical protein ACON4E_06555 [Flavobacteriales bacterium]